MPAAARSAESAQKDTPTTLRLRAEDGAASGARPRRSPRPRRPRTAPADASERTSPAKSGVRSGATSRISRISSSASSAVSPGIVRRSAWSDAARRVARVLLPAFDQRRVQRCRSRRTDASDSRAAAGRAPRYRRGRGPSSRSRRSRGADATRAQRGRSSRPRDGRSHDARRRPAAPWARSRSRRPREARRRPPPVPTLATSSSDDGGDDHIARGARAASPRRQRACTPRGFPSCRTRRARRADRPPASR